MTMVLAGNSYLPGLRAEFVGTYNVAMAGVEKQLGDVMQLRIPSDKLTEYFHYFETAPYPVRWRRGDAIPEAAFEDKQFNVTNYDFGRRIPAHINDIADDVTKALMPRIRSFGSHFASLPSRIFYQMITGAADHDLLPAVPNAPDGAALYSATNGAGGARFGVTDGNLLTGTGIGTAAAIRADFFNAIERFMLFKDTEGQPLFPSEIIDQGFVLFYNAANMQIVNEAFVQARTLQVGGTDAGAAVTNIVMDSGLSVALRPSQRITDNDMFVFAKGSPVKPLFQLDRQTMLEYDGMMSNSDSARSTKIVYFQADVRQGYGVALPYGTVKINNA